MEKNNNLTIYVCTHVDIDMTLFNDDVFKIIKNTDTNNRNNIFNMDKAYSEGSQLYYIWKNLDLPEYIGTCQYRKVWGGNIPDVNNTDFDIILPEPMIFKGYNNYIQYSSVLNINDYILCEYIIKMLYPEYINDVNTFNHSNVFYPYNMFIMPKELFNKYCEFVFTVLFKYDKIMGFTTSEDVLKYVESHKENYLENGKIREDCVSVARTEGHLLERLTNIFVIHNCKNIMTLSVKFINNI